MIDRSYLPFQAAREHYDRGMEKWMGFFLSEHTSSLKADKTKELLHTNLTKDQKALLLSQPPHWCFYNRKRQRPQPTTQRQNHRNHPTRNHHQNEIPLPPHQNQGHPSNRRRSRGSVKESYKRSKIPRTFVMIRSTTHEETKGRIRGILE